MTTIEALAVTSLRRWAQDRSAIRNCKSPRAYSSGAGWIERRSCDADARQVRVIDFERAFDALPDADKLPILLTYRDGVPAHAAARILHTTPSVASYNSRQALTRLANILDRLDLL
jgi:hypothetical protein